MAATTGTSRSLEDTPTWALATVCFVFIFLSIFIEYLIHLVSSCLKRYRKTALIEAVEKLKSVLMLLGFMSLLLAVSSRPITKICISNKASSTMLPCRKSAQTKTTKALGYGYEAERSLEEKATEADFCGSKNMTSLISQQGMNQLQIFIFVLAFMQIIYSVVTIGLGRAKMKRWKQWEKETQTLEYLAANDPNRFRLTTQTTFGRRHMNSLTTISLHLWIKCFFRQFFHSVAKVDYLTLRNGFISAHLSTNNSFNFQKYIQRSLEDDFKIVVGISPFMWLIVVIFLLLDVHGWHVYLWVSFLPLIIVLVLGTKLEVIVASMALEVKDHNHVIKGSPLVKPNDKLFWFSHPNFVLTLLHFTLFMNAFELAFFVWVTLQFGINSCYHERLEIIIIRVVLAVTVQVLCGYITLPLYALVTQMGSNFKSAVLEEQTASVIKEWHAGVRQKRKKLQQDDFSQSNHVNNSSITSTSQDLSSHERSPTFAEFPSGLTQTEIVECDNNQENADQAPDMVELEMPEWDKPQTSND